MNVTLTGKLSPFYSCENIPDQPVLIELPSSPGSRWVVVFSQEEDLHKSMMMCGIADYKIKLIQDGREFVDSIISTYRIMLDPRIVDGKTRWTEISYES